MKKIFVLTVLFLSLVSCARDFWGSGTYLFENASNETVIVITYSSHELMEFDTTLSILPNTIDTIHHVAAIGSNFSPTFLDWLRVYDSNWQLIYEQNPIDESLWIVEPQYKIERGDYGHTLNTFVFTDSLIQR